MVSRLESSYLEELADRAMLERDLDPAYSEEAAEQARETLGPATDPAVPDLRDLPWCSIDNGEKEEVSSKDLDQITMAEKVNGSIKVRVAVADVDALVKKDSPIDRQARRNTTTVYCSGKTYPMIHPRFSEDFTSLNEGEDRLAVVTEMDFDEEGKIVDFQIYRALVHNRVKLNYQSTGAWLGEEAPAPLSLTDKIDVQESLRLQDDIAQKYKERRRRQGSLTLESLEARAKMEQGVIAGLEGQLRNRATELIENLMVACNGCASQYLKSQNLPTLQRIVRKPKYWSSIADLAADMGHGLPEEPDSKALEEFLVKQREVDPLRFPDLCLEVLKLLGRGEYAIEMPGQAVIGHFGLAVRDYSHSTAPNRRYPDVITQRLLKAALSHEDCPYDLEELEDLALHCSRQEANAQKVERQTQKSAAAALLSHKIGETFQVVVSGQNQHGTWVRLLDMPVEGKLLGKAKMGKRLQVRLVGVNIERGFIDFSLR